MLLGTAATLSKMQKQLPGTVYFLFQHAEELYPGGAQEIIKSGALKGVDAFFGLHEVEAPRMTASEDFSYYKFKFRKLLNLLVDKASVNKLTRIIVSKTFFLPDSTIDKLTFFPCQLVNSSPCQLRKLSLRNLSYKEVAPTCFVVLGVGDGPVNHSPKFKIDEAALSNGVKAEVQIIKDYLMNK